MNSPVIFAKHDYEYMARAIQLAKQGRYTTHPNPRVGCVLVKNKAIIGEGYHQRAGEPHAEILALRSCQQNPQQATAYVTLEPCSHTGKTPPCANALIEAGISTVIIAMQDPNPLVAGKGIQRMRDAGIVVHSGLLESQARELNPGFIKRMEKGLPWVRIKMAMSVDGRTAMASGESQWITASDARYDVQKWRASADVILSGIGTVLADDPSLNVRLNPQDLGFVGEVCQPRRVILDSQLQIPIHAKLLGLTGATIICCSSVSIKEQPEKVEQLKTKGVQILSFNVAKDGPGQFRLPLNQVLETLAAQQVNEIHVEAGATLCGALMQNQLVDELVIYTAPVLMGSDAIGLLNLPGLNTMANKIPLVIIDIRAVGNDWRIHAKMK